MVFMHHSVCRSPACMELLSVIFSFLPHCFIKSEPPWLLQRQPLHNSWRFGDVTFAGLDKAMLHPSELAVQRQRNNIAWSLIHNCYCTRSLSQNCAVSLTWDYSRSCHSLEIRKRTWQSEIPVSISLRFGSIRLCGISACLKIEICFICYNRCLALCSGIIYQVPQSTHLFE